MVAGLAVGSPLLVTAQSLPDIRQIFENELACLLVEPLLADMSAQPLYSQQSTDCLPVVPDEQSNGVFFKDSDCQLPIEFSATPLIEHCSLLLDATMLGEGHGLSGSSWTLPPGTLMDLGARALDGLVQPYMQRSIYRTVNTARGQCRLEMRVYTRHPAVQGQRSLLALHGGSWSARGFGFFGLELTVPHFVNQGFVVYAPFYRLLGDTEGSAACNNATINDITDDAQAALTWVQDNAAKYGSAPEPVVFGQSAGAHLAASLAVNRSDEVSAAVLFYPPTDFTDFTLRVREGYYTNEQGLNILQRVTGTTAAAADISASPIVENSFPITVAEQSLTIPPVFMLHGMADDLVEARQSVRLCEAIDQSELIATDQSLPLPVSLRETRSCGRDSILQLIRQGEHALDVCLADTIIPTDLCPSGSDASRTQVAQAILESAEFARRHAANESGEDTIPALSSGGSLSIWFLLLFYALYVIRSGEHAVRTGMQHRHR